MYSVTFNSKLHRYMVYENDNEIGYCLSQHEVVKLLSKHGLNERDINYIFSTCETVV